MYENLTLIKKGIINLKFYNKRDVVQWAEHDLYKELSQVGKQFNNKKEEIDDST